MAVQEEEPLPTTRKLILVGFIQMFSNSLNQTYNTLLVAAAGATVNQMGFLQGTKALSSNLFQLLFGRLADKYGKKQFIASGRFLNAGAIAALIYFKEPTQLIWIVILSSFFNSMSIPAWSSLLGDYTIEKTRGEVIGMVNSFSQVGSFTAMIVAFFISVGQKGETTIQNFRIILALSAISSLITGIMILFIDEKKPNVTRGNLHFEKLVNDPMLTRYLLLNFIYGIGMSFAFPFFPMVITHRFRMRVWQISTLSLTSSIANSLAQRRLGSFMDRIGRRPIIVFSRVIMSISPLVYALAEQWWHVVLAELFVGLGMAAWMSSESTYIIDLAPKELRATYLASSTAVFGFAIFIGSNISGYFVDNFLNGLGSLNLGLLISSALRVVFGLAYFKAYESLDVTLKNSM